MKRSTHRGAPEDNTGALRQNCIGTVYLAHSTVRIEQTDRVGLVARIERHETNSTPNPEYARLSDETAKNLCEVSADA